MKTYLKRRKNIRLPKEIYSKKNLIFSIIICTKDRKPLFRNKQWAMARISLFMAQVDVRQSNLSAKRGRHGVRPYNVLLI